jgi:hypothetical protein
MKFIFNIFKEGLKTPSERGPLKPVLDNHIRRDVTFKGIENWADAVFVSPSANYSAEKTYAENITINDSQYSIILFTYIKPSFYT